MTKAGATAFKVTAPIFVFADDMSSYASIEDAEADLEHWLIEEDYGVFGFDAVGQPLRFWVEDQLVRIGPADGPAQPEALEQALRDYIAGKERFAELEKDPDCDLACLVAEVHKVSEITYQPWPVYHFFKDMFAFLLWHGPKLLVQRIGRKQNGR
jgi:hypothetical protein